MTEKERNKRLYILLQHLQTECRQNSIELLKTMVEKDTPAMQKTFEIMTAINEEEINGDGEVRPRSDNPSNP